jgi:hypothetical protein
VIINGKSYIGVERVQQLLEVENLNSLYQPPYTTMFKDVIFIDQKKYICQKEFETTHNSNNKKRSYCDDCRAIRMRELNKRRNFNNETIGWKPYARRKNDK